MRTSSSGWFNCFIIWTRRGNTYTRSSFRRYVLFTKQYVQKNYFDHRINTFCTCFLLFFVRNFKLTNLTFFDNYFDWQPVEPLFAAGTILPFWNLDIINITQKIKTYVKSCVDSSMTRFLTIITLGMRSKKEENHSQSHKRNHLPRGHCTPSFGGRTWYTIITFDIHNQ